MAIDAEDGGLTPLPIDSDASQTAPKAWITVAVLVLIGVFGQLDARVLSFLVRPIEHDFHVSDTAMGWLNGLITSAALLFAGVFLSRYVDRGSRKTIIAICLAVCSAASALCGLAQNFIQLVLARLLLGAGESLNGPASFSLLADLFPKSRLPRAIAVVSLGGIMSGGVSLLVLSEIIRRATLLHPFHLDGLLVHGWQIVMVCVGLPGILLAPIAYALIAEPARRGLARGETQRKVPLTEVLRYLVGNGRLYGPMFIGLGLSSITGGGRGFWDPAFFDRTYHWPAFVFARINGLIDIPIGLLGLGAGVVLVERLTKAGYADAPLRVVVISRLISVPALMIMPLMPTPWLAVAMLAIASFALMFGTPSQNAALQVVTPNAMRGQVTALYLFMVAVVGSGLGPPLVGMLNDYLFHSGQALRWSLLTVHVILQPLSVIIIALGLKPFVEAVRAQQTA